MPKLLAFFLCAAALCRGGQTHIWDQSEFADFEKATLKNLSLRSDGRLMLAPRFEERFDSSLAYLWALAQDSKGNLYAGGGPGAKLFRITPSGDRQTLAELDALEIHAIAIDRKDRVYAATSPDGKVYRIGGDGKPEVFYSPQAKYIWAMAFNSRGDLFVAAGGPGEVHRVSPDGKGQVFFKSEDTHVRSMAIDRQDNLILGTDPEGLVIRVSPSGDGFVLYDAPKQEITGVAVAPDGVIYAAGVGNKQAGPPPPAVPPVVIPVPSTIATMQPARPPAPAPQPPAPAPITGGSDLYRIDTDGYASRVWSHAQEIVYAIGFDSGGRVLLGTGNKGVIYRIDSERLSTALLNAPPTQVTCFAAGRGGAIYAATGNVGKVYQIGPELEPEGWAESDVFDAGLFSYWGRLSFEAAGSRVAIATRSGNLDRPQKNWSAWSPAITSPGGARVVSPPARFLQWKATLTREGSSPPPELIAVDVAYLPRNVPPRVSEIEITPPNYRFPASALSITPSRTLALPPLGKPARAPARTVAADTGTSTPSMEYAKGYAGARWLASDENGDTLLYTVFIRGEKETQWKLLRDKLKEKYLSWDSTAFPDGEYRLRVVASDAPSNAVEQALSGALDGEPFRIDNTPPEISGLSATRRAGKIEVRWRAKDALSVIEKAEYSLDGGEWTLVNPVTVLSDSKELDYALTLDAASPGEHTVAVRVQDSYDNQSADKTVIR
jgi:sugar lactone lactonase YvrE